MHEFGPFSLQVSLPRNVPNVVTMANPEDATSKTYNIYVSLSSCALGALPNKYRITTDSVVSEIFLESTLVWSFGKWSNLAHMLEIWLKLPTILAPISTPSNSHMCLMVRLDFGEQFWGSSVEIIHAFTWFRVCFCLVWDEKQWTKKTNTWRETYVFIYIYMSQRIHVWYVYLHFDVLYGILHIYIYM